MAFDSVNEQTVKNHIKVDLSVTHRANLKKLADYLLNLPESYGRFDMRTYCTSTASYISPPDSALMLTNCGSVACAAGHGPAAGVVPCELDSFCKHFYAADQPDVMNAWHKYIEICFGFKPGPDDDFENCPGYDWCFCEEWYHTDDTHHAAAKRILYMLEFGVPENHIDQKEGEAPLCYV